MSLLIDPLSSNFLPSFLAGVAVNFEIAAIALAVGLGLGICSPSRVSAEVWPAWRQVLSAG